MKPLTVLIVDDDAGMRTSIARALRDFTVKVDEVGEIARFSIDTAETGEIAMRKIEASAPDILILDQKLPGIQGLSILERMSEQNLSTLTIMITGYATISNIVAATKRGAYDFLGKPFTPVELRRLVGKAATRQVLSKHTRRLAEERREVRFRLIQVLGHELKAPLNAIEGYLHMLENPNTAATNPELYQQCVDRSLFRIDGMRKLIIDLLDMTRIESGRKRRSLETVDLREVAQHAIENWASEAARREISVTLLAETACRLTADRGEMEMLLNNLVSNAIKYNRDKGTVEVTLSQGNGGTTLTVEDTGIGMSEEERVRLFGEFVRIKNAQTLDIAGSGLGLSIVKKLAELYNGTAEVQSVPNIGTAFTVVLNETSLDSSFVSSDDGEE
jgi:two-component system, sensor histidine kinase and response regulator